MVSFETKQISKEDAQVKAIVDNYTRIDFETVVPVGEVLGGLEIDDETIYEL